jgi:hypothetical protein
VVTSGSRENRGTFWWANHEGAHIVKRVLIRLFLILWLVVVTVLLPIGIAGIVTEVLYPGNLWWLGIVAGAGALYFLLSGKNGSLLAAWKAALKPNWRS